jgi:hypothetical protein
MARDPVLYDLQMHLRVTDEPDQSYVLMAIWPETDHYPRIETYLTTGSPAWRELPCVPRELTEEQADLLFAEHEGGKSEYMEIIPIEDMPQWCAWPQERGAA